jgi:hypothetical protein
MRRVLCFLATVLTVAPAADSGQPHAHEGILAGFERQRPSRAGFHLDAAGEARLASGEPVVKIESCGRNAVRTKTIIQVATPPEYVWDVVLDFASYPRRVHGISACHVYDKAWNLRGVQVVKATYEAKVGAFKLQYFLEHVYEPLRSSMTWRLDYARRSDLDDNVGYWHVVPTDGGTGSRVFYATETVFPPWVPGPVKMAFARVAMGRATATLEPSCLEAMAQRGHLGSNGRRAAVRGLQDGLPDAVQRLWQKKNTAILRFMPTTK